ncbi:hypothetical protein TIFTF001_008592 [Ficus carica]|uniref:Uncharacterized protein n=1 Tax=Ficus carica TaxID=3494 RepID=A0AA88AFA6_FICCA|nr:hypothetical protein TIFTF001_008592 [Ficus carica]
MSVGRIKVEWSCGIPTMVGVWSSSDDDGGVGSVLCTAFQLAL